MADVGSVSSSIETVVERDAAAGNSVETEPEPESGATEGAALDDEPCDAGEDVPIAKAPNYSSSSLAASAAWRLILRASTIRAISKLPS